MMLKEQKEAAAASLMKIAQSSQEYYQLLNEGPGEEHFESFIASLPESMQVYYRKKGYRACRKNILFRRFVLEQAGRRMDAFLRERLDVREYKLWLEQDSYQIDLLFRLKQSA